jgi:hypothetical protein
MSDTDLIEAKRLYDDGHTFYAISTQMNEWYGKTFTTPEKIGTALGLPNNPLGRQNGKKKP